MKIEVTAARARTSGVRLRERLIAELPRYAPLVSRFPAIGNLRNTVPPLRRVTERLLGFSAARQLPAWSKDRFLDQEAETEGPAIERLSLP